MVMFDLFMCVVGVLFMSSKAYVPRIGPCCVFRSCALFWFPSSFSQSIPIGGAVLVLVYVHCSAKAKPRFSWFPLVSLGFPSFRSFFVGVP